MIAIPLVIVLLLSAAQQLPPQQQGDPAQQQRLKEAQEKYEPMRQAAIQMNDLAGNIHSEADARAYVDAVAEWLNGNKPSSWTTLGIRHRVAHAEYEAVSDPSHLIPEQRVADLWNKYVRELNAPEETLVTAAEVHNLRDATYTSSQLMWKKIPLSRSPWLAPDIYAVGADGKVAGGCRAVEALRIFHDMFYLFQNVKIARERVQKGVLASDLARQREQDPKPRPQTVKGQLIGASQKPNPVMPAAYRYVQAHGEADYRHLLERLFAELFPRD